MIGIVLGLVLSISLAHGQESSNQKQADERIITVTSLVTVNVTVTDSKGKYVKGLRQEQFDIYDERARQQIAHFAAEAAPVSIGIM